MKKIFLLSLVSIIVFSSCRQMGGMRVRGSGHITTETRSTGDFNSVDAGGAIEVYVRQDSTTSVKVEADDNVQDYLEIYTEGSVLYIHTQNGINLRTSRMIKVFLTSPSFSSFEISGASKIYCENELSGENEIAVRMTGSSGGKLLLNSPKVSVDLSGASNISIDGKTKDFKVEASGASHVKSYDLLTENTTVDLGGASSVDVFASVSISGEVSGASHVNYKGNASQSIRTSGAGGVNHSGN